MIYALFRPLELPEGEAPLHPAASPQAVAVLAAALAIRLVQVVLSRAAVPDHGRRRASAASRAAELRAEAKLHPGADGFAARAKAERGALALERQVELWDAEVARGRKNPLLRVSQLLWLLYFGLAALTALALPRTHAASLPSHAAGFLRPLLARGWRGTAVEGGGVGIRTAFWAYLCFRAVRRVLPQPRV